MSHSHRIYRAGAAAAAAAEASARAGHAVGSQDSLAPATTFMAEGVVLEVLASCSLAHVRTADGATYGLTQSTHGIRFADLREGQRVRAGVTKKFGQIVHATLLGDSSAQSVREGDDEGGARP